MGSNLGHKCPDNRPTLLVDPSLREKWVEHQEWANCQACPLSKFRHKIVLARGTLPADILFIGEAPGPTENIFGIPFHPSAPAGGLLDQMIEAAYFSAGFAATPLGFNHPDRAEIEASINKHRLVYCITNIVACFPQRSPAGDFREPNKEEALACRQRLLEFIALCRPRLIVTLGQIAERYLPDLPLFPPPKIDTRTLPSSTVRQGEFASKPRVLNLLHPSAIVRLERENPKKFEILKKRFVLSLASTLCELNAKN